MAEDRKTWVLKGLSCASCARKIEYQICSMEDVGEASVNFADGTLQVRLDKGRPVKQILAEIRKVVKEIEAHVEVVDSEEAAEEEGSGFLTRERLLLGGGILLFGFAIWLATYGAGSRDSAVAVAQVASKWLYIAAYLIIGGGVLRQAFANIIKGRIFDENFLMGIATVGAIVIGEYPEAVAVMLFYRIGEAFQDAAVHRSRASIRSLMQIRPDKAHLIVADGIKTVAPETILPGERILVKPGERVPLDGRIVEGATELDTSTLTGESLPRMVGLGDDVLSGSVNGSGVVTIEVLKPFHESTVSKILELVQHAASQKAPTEQFITKFAKIYTPLVVLAATLLAVLPPLLLPGATFEDWLYRALVFLVISCPCALVISIPLAFFGGIGGASARGILVKGGNHLEALQAVDTVVFDKTGTMTQGRFQVVKVAPTNGFSSEEILDYAAHGEAYAAHPAAKALLKAYGSPLVLTEVVDYVEHPGLGVTAMVRGRSITIGSYALLAQFSIDCESAEEENTIIYIAIDGRYAGYILIADEIKPGARAAVDALRAMGVRRMAILSGDRLPAVRQVAKAVGILEYYGELLPHEKVSRMEEIVKAGGKGKTAFVGDGINDAPVLALADIGMAMGGIGSDAAIEAADVVLMTDELGKVAEAVGIARKTRRIVLQNIMMALCIKGIVLIFGASGHATMWEAVFADVGAALLAVLNSIRVLKYK